MGESESESLEIRAIELLGITRLYGEQYGEAEALFRQQYERLLGDQEIKKRRVHKGAVLFNLGLAQFLQGKTSEAIEHFAEAYIEDLISSKDRYDVDTAPASAALRSLCGATWHDLSPFEETVFTREDKSGIKDPKSVYDGLVDVGEHIIVNYQEHLGSTWKSEAEGRHYFRTGYPSKAEKPYRDWYQTLLQYEKVRKVRIHKGHPLYNMGISLSSDPKKALELFVLAYIEDVLSERRTGQAEFGDAFKVLNSGYEVAAVDLQGLAKWIASEQIAEERPESVFRRFKEANRVFDEALTVMDPSWTMETPVTRKKAVAREIPAETKGADVLPGSYDTRVFIGGSYSIENTLREIEKYVRQCEMVGIIAMDYQGSGGPVNIHERDVLLLSQCKYAIFELSIPGGEIGEIEWARTFQKTTWGAKTRYSYLNAHTMGLLQNMKIQAFEYSRNEELCKYIMSELSKIKSSSSS